MSNKKGLLLAIGVVLLGLIITAGSYAFWSWNSNPNKSVAFNTSKALRNYIVYNEGESKFVGDFKVGSNYQDNSIHSTISLYKTEDAANVTLMATIHMDVNKIGENMKKSNALKWVVTKGNSTNPGEVLAQGNFVGTNNGDTLTLVPNIEVTTTNTEYTVWIWLDRNANPSDALSGETLDTNVWTEINQLEGVEDRFEITRLSANYQNINATVVDSKAKVTHYAVVAKGATPSTWTSVGTATNIYNLNTTVDATGEYDVYFKDELGKTTHKTVTVTAIDNTAPTCTFDSWSVTPIANNETSDIVLTCTDNESEITVNNLKATDITRTNNNITITNIKKSSISNGYKYTITVKGTETDGTSKLTLPTAKIKNAMALGNAEVSSATITVANKYTVVYQSGNNNCELNTTTYANKTATYGTAYSVANPTCTGYTFDGWTANSGLDTTNAKYGNSSSTVTTTWSNASTKVKATWFNNLALRTVKTVTLTANWTASDLTFNDQTLNTGTYGTAYTSNAFTGASNGTGSYTYTIKSGEPTGATIDSTNRKISFTNTTNAGTYNVVVTVKDNNSNKTKDATMKIVINRQGIAFPTCVDKTYTAAEQTLFAAHTSGQYTNSVLKGTNVNSYTVDLTPTSNYQWNSGSNVTSARTLTCKIVKADTTTTANNVSKNYTGSAVTGSASAVLKGTTTAAPSAAFTYTYYNGNSCSGTALSGAPKDYRDGGYSFKATLTGTANYNTSTSDCSTLVIGKIAQPMTFTTPQSGSVTFSTSAQSKAFTAAASAQGAVTYSITSQKQGSTNVTYFTIPTNTTASISVAANTPVGTYTIVVRASAAGNTNYNSGTKDMTYTLTVNKGTCVAPTNVTIGTDKKVSWTASATASSYEISMSASSGFVAHTSGSVYNDITASTGSRTVYVRSVCDSSKYNTPSANASKATTVYSVALTNGTGISAVSGAGNYITGATVSIDATVATGYTWSKWTQTSGGAQVSTTKAYSAAITSNWAYTAYAVDDTNPTVQDIGGGTTLKATSQTLTLKCTDNIGVTAYYFGTTEPNTADKITTTTSADLTALQGSGLTKTVTAAGTYYLACRDAAGNYAKKSITIVNYSVNNLLENITGDTDTYKNSNYESVSSNSYIVKSGTSLTLASVYGIPTGSSATNFKGYSTSYGTSAVTPSTTAPTVSNGTTYYMWFNRNTYNVKITSGGNGLIDAYTTSLMFTRTPQNLDGEGTAGETNLNVKYGDIVSVEATPNTGYSLLEWSGGYVSGTDNPATGAAITANKTITGTFSANTYTINYYQGNGTSTAGSTKIGSSTCTYGQSCTLTTYADLGSTFPISSASNTTSSNSCNHYWSFHSWTTSSTGGLDKAYDNGATFTYDNAGDLNLYAIGYRRFYFSTGQKPTSLGTGYAPYQYWNPYSTADAYRTSVDIPSGESISGWTFLGYGNDQANGTVIYNTSQVGTSLKPAYDACRWLRSKYSRTLTIQYQGNGSTSGSTSNTTATQYYNSGYVNNGANVEEAYSYPSFTLRANGFTKTGHVFSKWADGSTSGTKYNANASYSAWKPVIGDSTTKNMYAIWTAKSVTVIFNCNGNTSENNIFTYGSSSGKDGSGNTIEKKFTNTCSRTGYTFNKWQAPNGTNTWGQYSSVTDNWINDVYDHNTYGNTNSNITLTATWTDSTLPTGSVTGSVSGAKLSATVTATDTGSGIKASYGWKYSTSSTCNSSTTGFTDSTSNSYNFNLTSTGVYYVCVRIEDNAGNKNYVVSNAIAATYSSADFTFSNTGSGCKTVSCNSTMCTVTLKCTGTLTVAKKSKYQAFLVGGGGGGGTGSYACGGGGGYTTTTTKADMPVLKYYVTIGSGGAKDTDGTASNIKKTSSSGDTIATANGGKKGNKGSGYSTGGAGGSGGGFWNSSGGSNGSYGIGNNGGAGQKTTTRAFGESSGTLYAGGGSGQDYTTGGAGGGGAGGSPSNPYGSAGTANTGGGGGGGFNAGGAGGSGIVIFRFYNSDSAIPPTCKLTVSSSKVTLTYGSSVTSYGLVKGTTKNYNSTTSLSISAGTFTGFVKNSLGTEATCTTTVAATTTSTYKCCDSQGWYLINNGRECTFQMTQFAPSSDCTKVTCPSGYTEISGSTAYCYK